MTIFVPGVFGDGAWYDGIVEELDQAAGPVHVVTWGAPKATFTANFSDPKIHAEAEAQLAARIDALPSTVQRIHLVGHSAGCGVILGALQRTNRRVTHAVLIAPSVSPGYDLAPAAGKVAWIDVFYSEHDRTFLKWRTGNFGTYDNIKTPAAGYSGFTNPPANVRQHSYDPAWRQLGNDGGHAGGVARTFVAKVVSPLLGETDETR